MKVEKLDRIAVICPTRGRPQTAHEILASWIGTNSGKSDFWFAVDDDEAGAFPGLDQAQVLVTKRGRRGMADSCNAAAANLAQTHQYVMFVGDDHRFRTPGWDAAFIGAANAMNGCGFVYGNDLYHGANLPTAVMVTSNIIEALGHFIWPELQHLYIDNYWLALGEAIERITYLDQVVIEHMHYIVGKSARDACYDAVNAPDLSARDRAAFEAWNAQMKIVEAERIREFTKCES